MKVLYLFCILSINCNAQGNNSDSLNQGECWNIQYQNINDLGLKKYEIGIRYKDEKDFILDYRIFVADSITLYSRAMFVGRKGNPYDTTLNEIEINYLSSNKLILETKYSINSISHKQLQELIELKNVSYEISYSLEDQRVKTYPMSKYYGLQGLYNEMLKTESTTEFDGFYISTYCTVGCEGCHVSFKIPFYGEFRIAKSLGLIN